MLTAHISASYGSGPEVLRDFRVEIGEGEIFGLAGQSGSGKSTFALALLGLLEARAQVKGSILFRGQELTRFNDCLLYTSPSPRD